MKQIIIFFTLLLNTLIAFCQINEGGQPYSFSVDINQPIETFILQPPSLDSIIKQDSVSDLYRVAVNVPCQISIYNKGSWTHLNNGYKVWRLAIKIPQAKGLGIYFNDEIVVPKQSQLFVYNKNKTQILGAYTNNTPPFKAIEVVEGDELIIEFQTPISNDNYPNLNINEIAYFYRGFESKFAYYNRLNHQNRDNGSCEVNVACDEGILWQKQIDAVVLYSFKDGGYTYVCSATIINNTNFDCKPYILTADHCGHPTTSTQVNTNIWYFNYQNPNCDVGSTLSYNGNLSQTMVGGKLRASSSLGNYSNNTNLSVNGSDFVLIELNTNIPESYHPYFAGWSLDDIPSNSGVCIHHPGGSDKKISTYASPIFTTSYNEQSNDQFHWGVIWSATQNGHGVTEGGSSGSPLFNSKGQIIGALSGGAATCESPTLSDLYGKFNIAWQSEGMWANQRLNYWLDSSNTKYKSINGSYYPCSNTPITDSAFIKNLIDVTIYPNPTPNLLYVDLLYVTDSITQITITDLTGKKVYSIYQPEGILIIDFTNFAIGTYFVKIESESEILIKKIIKI